eukprot:TRINITY_DN2890_c0_g1_i2.p1 TRINITY_DN2890_c0_g1~~TRINITY_DN2890_c0_g1_i2.p1  ORF type:complete len:131 (-),score=42.68 TRINITY_DN2890_c0_g1_i2:11-403(-)
MKFLEEKGAAHLIQPLFISVDPLRDSVKGTRDYLKDFHPSIIGLTGTPEQVERVCKAYRVYFSKANVADGENKDDDYLLDHSIILYFMDPQGELAEYFGQSVETDRISQKILNRLKPEESLLSKIFGYKG